MAIAQSQAGNIGVISAISAGNTQSHSEGHSYSPSHDAGYSYPAASAVAQIPIPSYSSGPLQQEVKVVKIVEDHGHGSHSHTNVVAPQPAPQQHVKHIKVHQGLQSYPDHGYYSSPAAAQYIKVLRISHQAGQVVPGDGQQPQNIEVIRVHHNDHGHGHGHSAPIVAPIVQQKQVIRVIHDHGPIDHSAHHSIAQPIIQHQAAQQNQVKVIKVYHDNGPINHGYAAAAKAAPLESGWAPPGPLSVGW